MASAAQVTVDYRRLTLALRAGTLRDLLRLWPALDWARLDATYPAWAAAVFTLVQRDRGTATGLASAYLRSVRSLSKVAGPAQVVVAAPLDVDLFGASMRSTTVAAIKKSALAGMSQKAAMQNAFVQSSGAATRHVLNAGRDTVRLTTEADPHARGWTRVTSGRSCEFCNGLADGSVLPGSVDMATHDHCVTPDTIVRGPLTEVAYRRWYEGELIVVGLSTGEELSITPNHPVLTRYGWVEPKLLNVGDEIAQRSGADAASLQVPYEEQAPSCIEDAWRAYAVDGFRSMPVSAEDFHGDGHGTQGNVDVVTADRLLANMVDSALRELLREPVGAGTRSASIPAALSTRGDSLNVFVGEGCSTDGIMRGRGLGSALLWGERRLMQNGRLERPADFYAGLVEATANDWPRDAVGSGEGLLGLARDVPGDNFGRQCDPICGGAATARSRYDPPPTEDQAQRLRVHSDLGRRLLERLTGGVQLTRVSDLRRVNYAGHVFNLQTTEGWYEANSVIVSNCSCSPQPVYR